MRKDLIENIVGQFLGKDINYCKLTTDTYAFGAFGLDAEELAFMKSAAQAACAEGNSFGAFALYIDAKMAED